MTLHILTICEAISELEVSGVRIYDITDIPAKVDPRQPSILPIADPLVTGFEVIRESYGGGSSALITCNYTLNYRLCYIPSGMDPATTLKHFSQMVDVYARFIDQVLLIDTINGAVDIIPNETISFGIVYDPADNPFWGCDIQLRVTDFWR